MQREPRDSRARATLQLGRFAWLRVVDRAGICASALDGTVRMFTQGKPTEEYTVIAGPRQQVHESAAHSPVT